MQTQLELGGNEVIQGTFGHLAPKKNHAYCGHMIMANPIYGLEPVILFREFHNLNSSPWLYDAEKEFAYNVMKDMDSGAIVEFTGAFINYTFQGTLSMKCLEKGKKIEEVLPDDPRQPKREEEDDNE